MVRIDDIIVGKSIAIEEVKKLVQAVAKTSTTVLVQGETGTGKEVISRAIHELSGRKGKLISVNCAAIPTELLESELFGHERGAFTGAEKTRAGRFEQAHGGTLFLDEIGDMAVALQSKLLRALEQRIIQRVGGNEEIEIDFRLVCATHQNIEAKIDEGSFRSDLYYRINVFPVQVPSLAERAVDIPDLVEAMGQKMINASLPKFDDSGLTELSKYPWPGNVRELRNVIERASVLFQDSRITSKHVRENLLRLKVPDREEEQSLLWDATADLMTEDDFQVLPDVEKPIPHPTHYKQWFSYFDTIDLRKHLRDVEVVLIEAALEKTEGMVSQAASSLKLRRTTLIEKMKKLMIEKPTPNTDTPIDIETP
ncbi:MAG: sigma-54-dependent Fis family transcriptional regulator [Alphaproteobacteria bacterium]|nr:sigma-54-dependent Fis family transcriptional regulator [Alphaproteobacteria bacterium]